MGWVFGNFRRIGAYEYVADHNMKMSLDKQCINYESIVYDDNGAIIGWLDTDGYLLITNGDKFPPQFVNLVVNEDCSRGYAMEDFGGYMDDHPKYINIADSVAHPILAKHFDPDDVTWIVSRAEPDVLSALESVLSIPSFHLSIDTVEPYNQFFVVTSLSGKTYLDFKFTDYADDYIAEDFIPPADSDIGCDMVYIVRIDLLTGEAKLDDGTPSP
jgi:hypothetical protein